MVQVSGGVRGRQESPLFNSWISAPTPAFGTFGSSPGQDVRNLTLCFGNWGISVGSMQCLEMDFG